MILNLQRTIPYENELKLAGDIVQWLDSVPSLEDILYYLSKIPEDMQQPIADYVVKTVVESLYDEKYQYFTTGGCEAFLRVLSEEDQLYYLSCLAEYSFTSVLKNLAKQAPELGGLTFPADCHEWARHFMDRLNAATTFGVASQYPVLTFYGEAISKSSIDFAQLEVIQQELSGLLAAVKNRFDHNAEMTQAEKNQEVTVLLKLGFM